VQDYTVPNIYRAPGLFGRKRRRTDSARGGTTVKRYKSWRWKPQRSRGLRGRSNFDRRRYARYYESEGLGSCVTSCPDFHTSGPVTGKWPITWTEHEHAYPGSAPVTSTCSSLNCGISRNDARGLYTGRDCSGGVDWTGAMRHMGHPPAGPQKPFHPFGTKLGPEEGEAY